MLYKVWRKNDRFTLGDIYRAFDDGCEKCIMEYQNGRQQIVGYTGLVVPFSELEPFVIAIKKNGFDYNALRNRQEDAG